MASKNEHKAKADMPHKNRKRGRSLATEEVGRSRANAPDEPAPRTRREKRAEAGSGSEASFQGPSGSEEGRGGRNVGQGEKRNTTQKQAGTGGSRTHYGPKV